MAVVVGPSGKSGLKFAMFANTPQKPWRFVSGIETYVTGNGAITKIWAGISKRGIIPSKMGLKQHLNHSMHETFTMLLLCPMISCLQMKSPMLVSMLATPIPVASQLHH